MKKPLWIVLALAACLVTGGAAWAQSLVINEAFPDSPSTDVDTWLELKGAPGMSLDGWLVIGVKGSDGTDYQPIPLDGYTVPSDGYFLITQDCARPHSNLCNTNVNFFNSNANIQLRYNGQVMDALAYGTPTFFFGEGTPAPNPNTSPPKSIARCPDGFDSNNNFSDFKLDDTPTPGTPNDASCPQGVGACCLTDGRCLLISQAECTAQGGNYLGDNTVCDPYPCPPMNVGLCDVRNNDINGVPVLLNRKIHVQGVATVASGTWSATTQDFQITDGNCCTDVFGGSIGTYIQIGDLVDIVGTVIQYNGKTEISNPGLVITVISSNNPVPTPAPLTTFELSVNGEAYESCLIALHCVHIVSGTWPASGSNGTVVIDDGSGPVDLFIDKDTDIAGSPEPTGPFSLVGIGNQYDNSSPYSDGYEAMPRGLSDFIYDCPVPTGACCFHSGTCTVLSAGDCAAQQGTWLGEGTLCDPNPCAQPTGACCMPDGTCTITLEAGCAGIWQGMDTLCEPNPCAQPTGACCYPPFFLCVMVTRAECDAMSGLFIGDFVPCDPLPCEPLGACCAATGECTVVQEFHCNEQGGTYQGDGIGCDPNPCPILIGACCMQNGECVILTEGDCTTQQGTWQGAGTGCDPNPCPQPTPTERKTWGQIKNQYR